MGIQENISREKRRNQNLKALVLGSVMVAGGLAVGLVAPNVLGALGKLGLVPKTREYEYINAARKRLKKQGLLTEKDGFLRITPRGEIELARQALDLARPRKLKKWDGKWRVLIFDVPEKKRSVRVRTRSLLVSAGLVRLQDSVWLYPYPCEEYVALLKAELKLGKQLLYLIVETIEQDSKYRKYFGLPLSLSEPAPPVKLHPLVESMLEPILPSR